MTTVAALKATEWNFPRFEELPDINTPVQFCLRDPKDAMMRFGAFDGATFRDDVGTSWPPCSVFAWRLVA